MKWLQRQIEYCESRKSLSHTPAGSNREVLIAGSKQGKMGEIWRNWAYLSGNHGEDSSRKHTL